MHSALGVAEFERAMIAERVRAGIASARESGTSAAAGQGHLLDRSGVATVQRIKAEMVAQ